MKQIIILLLIILLCAVLFKTTEGFSPYGPYQIGNNMYQYALGNATAGVNAIGGKEQEKQNAGAPTVTRIQPGNPQNVWAEYKKQP